MMRSKICLLWTVVPFLFFSCKETSEKELPVDDLISSELNGHEYVDLGLVIDGSPIYWATCNIGSKFPEEYGLYYAWGETTECGTAKNWSTYKFMLEPAKGGEGINKYTIEDYCYDAIWYQDGVFIGDNKSVLDTEDDAATSNWGAPWRTPTSIELNFLMKNCIWTKTSLNGVRGYSVQGKNGASIFLPASDEPGYPVFWGDYWSSSITPNSSQHARGMRLYGDGVVQDSYRRVYGLVIRPVWK